MLEDADDYLAAAVDDEDAMGKHRGGDPVKSLRFAQKALDLYTQGLSKHPKNFDLAYNKARLEIEIATHPTLVKALDVPVTSVLQQALTSHRYAISLDPDNADLLFNTAQVLTTISEYIAKDDSIPDSEALQYLEEALERQNQCLQIQQTRFAESRSIHEAAMTQDLDGEDNEDDDGGARLDKTTTSAYEDQSRDQQEQWVSIIEPVTANTLIDTILSQLSTLTTLCTILASSLATPLTQSPISPSWIESYSTNLTSNTLPSLLSDTSSADLISSRLPEVHRTKAIFAASLLDLVFHTQSITPETYISNLNAAFSVDSSQNTAEPEPDPETQIAHARALITLNSSFAEQTTSKPASASSSSLSPTQLTSNHWTTLTKAITLLTAASRHPTLKSDNHTLATTHLLRADISLLMSVLSRPPYSHPQAISNKPQLLKNAEVFYRNAGKLFGPDDEEKDTALFRGAVVEILKMTNEAGKVDGTVVRRILQESGSGSGGAEKLEEMIEEGLLEGIDLSGWGL